MQDPAAAADELKRCVNELGFKGALVNGFTQRDVEDSAKFCEGVGKPLAKTVPQFDNLALPVRERRRP